MSDLNEQLKTWPAEIWLNTGDDETLAAFDEYAEVSWCSLPQGPADVRYVREDRAPAAAPAPVAAIKTWQERLEESGDWPVSSSWVRAGYMEAEIADLRAALAPVVASDDHDPLSDFKEGQWWVQELDQMAQHENATPDQRRAVAVVHNMLSAALAAPPAPAAAQQPANVLGAALALCDYLIHQTGDHARAMACDLRPLVEASILATHAAPAAAPIVQPVADVPVVLLTVEKAGGGRFSLDYVPLTVLPPGEYQLYAAPMSSTADAKDAARNEVLDEIANIVATYSARATPKGIAAAIRTMKVEIDRAAITSSAGEVKP